MIRIAVAAALVALAVVPGKPAAQAAPAQQPPSSEQSSFHPPSREQPAPTQPSAAEPGGQSEAERKKLEEEIARELGAAPQQPAQPSQPTQPSQPGAAPPAAGGASSYARLLLMPDISAVGRFAGAYDSYDVESLSPRVGAFGPEDRVEALFEELEVALQAVVDPYARADVFVAFSPDEIAVEEAYLTTLNLPAGFQLRTGRFFSPFGRINGQHPHAWDFVDGPLAHGRLLAEEVLAGAGLDVAWLAPLPWYAELHLDFQSTAPDEDDESRSTGVVRLAQFFSLGEGATLGVGLSGGMRDDGGGVHRDLGGVDAYLRWRPQLARRAYLALQCELFARRLRGGEEDGTDTGWYAQAFWRQGAYAGFGARYDEAPSAGDAAPGTERRVSGLATWFLSEFQRIRLQLAWDRLPGGHDGVEALVHLEFGIGAHGAHPF